MSPAACLDGDYQDRIFLFGGSGIDIGKENLADLWEFNLSTLKFNEIRQCLKDGINRPPAMYGHSMNYFKNSLYIFGGTTGFDFFKDLFKYDLILNTW